MEQLIERVNKLATPVKAGIIFGIIVIGVIGLVSDLLFKFVNRQFFAWRLA